MRNLAPLTQFNIYLMNLLIISFMNNYMLQT